jgi:hypothetical protein
VSTSEPTTHRFEILRKIAQLSLLGALAAGCGGDDEDDAASDDDAESGDDESDGETGDPTPIECDVAPNRLDPGDAAGMSDADFHELGRARSGPRGAGTRQHNDTVRYVSAATGDDDADGSESAPWRSLQHAADIVDPGTTVLVDASAPYEGGLDLHRSGSDGAYIVFMPSDDDQMPTLVGASGRIATVDISASYVVFQGFEITGQRGETLADDAIGIQIEPQDGSISHVEIRNNLVHEIGPGQVDDDTCYYNAHGIIAQAEGDAITDLVIDGNELHDLYVGNSECLVVNGNIAGFCVTNNYVHDVDNIAIDIIGYEKNDSETARMGTIADNVVLDASNYWPYCSRGNCTYPVGDESSDGIYVDGGAELDISYNVVGRADHGIELQSENGQLIRDVEVAFNVVFNSNYKDLTLGETENSVEHDNLLFTDPALDDADLVECKP